MSPAITCVLTLVTVLLLAPNSFARTDENVGEGAGVCRNVGCCAVPPCGPQPRLPDKSDDYWTMDSCKKDAEKLRGRYRSLVKEIGQALEQSKNPTKTAAKDKLSQLYDEYYKLKKEWDELKAKCLKQGIDIGSLEGNELPTKTSDKDDEQRKRENKAEYRRMADTMDFFATEGKVTYVAGAVVVVGGTVAGLGIEELGEEVVFELSETPYVPEVGLPYGSGGLPTAEAEAEAALVTARQEAVEAAAGYGQKGLEAGHNYDIGSEAVENYEAMVTGWQEGAEAWRKAAADPPSPDYERIAQPKVWRLPSHQRVTKPRRLLIEAITARRNANAYIHVYVTSYERYQGAKAANDSKAMSLQAMAMERYSKLALTEARTASLKQYAFDTLLLANLEQLQSKMAARGPTWENVLSAYREKYGREGLPPRTKGRLTAAKWPESKIEELRGMIGELNHDKIAKAVKVLKGRVQQSTASSNAVNRKYSNIPLPEPPDISGLEKLFSTAISLSMRSQLMQAQQTWSLQPNSKLAVAQGQLVVAFPSGVNVSSTMTLVFQPGGQKPVALGLGSQSFVLSPGTYEVEIAKRRLTGVTIQAGHDTQFKVGALRVTADNQTTYDVLEPTEGRKLASGFGIQTIGLPVGNYQVRIRGKLQPVTIVEGRITDLR